MSEKKTIEGKSKYLVICLMLMLFLPLLYVLSIGPFVWLGHNGYLSQSVAEWLELAYFPLIWSTENSELAKSIMSGYLNLFVDYD